MGTVMQWSDITGIMVPLGVVLVGAVLWITKQLDNLKSEVSDFKTEVAKEYASMATLEKFESRLLTAIDKLGDRLDRRESH